MKRDPGFEAAWARVSILLNTGDVQAATTAATEASLLTRWRWDFGDYQNFPRYRVYGTLHLPVGWMWLEPAKTRVLLAEDTIGDFGISEQLWSFAELVLRVEEPTFRFYDVANWREMDKLSDR